MALFDGTLLSVRTKLAEISGRYDLVNSDFTDNGADFFINAAQEYLDKLADFDHNDVIISANTVAGEDTLNIGSFRALRGIRFVDSVSGSYYLTPYTKQDFAYLYGVEPYPASVENGKPLAYYVETLKDGTTLTDETASVRGIKLFPTPDAEYTLYLEGIKFSPKLEDETDVSYWSVAHPLLLIQATQYKLEQVYRNTQGANDFARAIMEEITLLNNDHYDELTGGQVIQLRDAW